MFTRPGAATTHLGGRPYRAVNSEIAVRDSTSYPHIMIRRPKGGAVYLSERPDLRRGGARAELVSAAMLGALRYRRIACSAMLALAVGAPAGCRYFSNILSTGMTRTLSFSIATGNRLMRSSSATTSGGVPAVS